MNQCQNKYPIIKNLFIILQPFVVEHELAHALGVIHQHERPDRDFYVDVLFDRIFPGFAHNFFKANEGDVGTFGIPYDVSSVMHYFPAVSYPQIFP